MDREGEADVSLTGLRGVHDPSTLSGMLLGDQGQIEQVRAFLAAVNSQAGINGATAPIQVKTENLPLFGQAHAADHHGNQNKRTCEPTSDNLALSLT